MWACASGFSLPRSVTQPWVVCKLKIAHISPPSRVPPKRYGGVERVVYYLAKEQARTGHSVTVYCGNRSTIPGCTTRAFTQFSGGGNWLRNSVIGSWHSANSYLHSGEFDIVHNHVSGEGGIVLSSLTRSPSVTTLHGIASEYAHRELLCRLMGIVGRTKLVAISQASLESHVAFFGKKLVGYVHNGMDLEDFQFVSEPKRSHAIQLCFVGKLAPEKGAHHVIAIADELLLRGKDVHLVILGKSSHLYQKYLDHLRKLVADRKHVTFVPDASNLQVREAFMRSDAAVFPFDRDEPFGMVMIEALACGTPAIATPRGAAPEIIDHGITGFLCPSFDDFVGAVLQVEKISRSECRRAVERKFSSRAMAASYQQVYERVIGAAGGVSFRSAC